MPRPELVDAVVRALSIELKVSEEDVRSARSLRDDLGMDSIAAANVLFALEDEFDCEISVDRAKRIETAADIARVLDATSGDPGH